MPDSNAVPSTAVRGLVPATSETADAPQDLQAIWLAEFTLLVNTGKDYFYLFLTAFGFYLAAIGALLNVFFDASPGSDERLVLFGFGVLIHVSAVLATLLGGRFYRPMALRCREVGTLLGCPDVYYPGTIGVACAFLGVEIVFLVAWIGVLSQFR